MRACTPSLAPLFLLAACASSAGPAEVVSAPTTLNTSAWGLDITLEDDRTGIGAVVPAEVEAVWAALADGYAELEIPIADLDRAHWLLGNRNHGVRRRLGEEPLSAYVNCGDNLTGRIADSYRVNLSVVSTLEPRAAAETAVTTRVDATAQSTGGASGHTVQCNTTRRLETRIIEMLRDRIPPTTRDPAR